MEEQLEAVKLKVLDRLHTALSSGDGDWINQLARAYLLLEQAHTEMKYRFLMRVEQQPQRIKVDPLTT